MSAVIIYISYSLNSNMASTNTTTNTTTQTASFFTYTTPMNDFVAWLNNTYDHSNPTHRDLCLSLLQRLHDWQVYAVTPTYRGKYTSVLESLANKKAYDMMCTASQLGFVVPSDVDVLQRLPLTTPGQNVLFFNCFSAMSKRCKAVSREFVDSLDRLVEFYDLCVDLRELVSDLESKLRQEKLKTHSLRARYDALSYRLKTSSARVAPAPPAPTTRVTFAPPAPTTRTTPGSKPSSGSTTLKRDRDFKSPSSSKPGIPQMAERLVEKQRFDDSCKRSRRAE